MEQPQKTVANFIQKTYDILDVQIILFRMKKTLKLYNGAKQAKNFPLKRFKIFSKKFYLNISDIEILIALLGS